MPTDTENFPETDTSQEKAVVFFKYPPSYKELVEFIANNIPVSAYKDNRVLITNIDVENGAEIEFTLTPTESGIYYENDRIARRRLLRYIEQRREIRYLDTFKITKDDICAYVQANREGLLEGDQEWQEYIEGIYNELHEDLIKDYEKDDENQQKEWQKINEKYQKPNT